MQVTLEPCGMPSTLKEDGKIRVFLLVKEVECEYVGTNILNVSEQVCSSIGTGKKNIYF
jgi:hypothetical protein